MKNSIPGLINITIDYPYPLSLPDGRYLIVLDTGEFGAIHLESKECLISIDKGKTTTNTKDKIKTIHKKKISAEFKMEMADHSIVYIDCDQNGKMLFPKNYTRLEVIFRVNDLRADISTNKNRRYIDDMAKKFIDKFLLSYMYGTRDCSIRINKKEEWPSGSIVKSYDFTKKEIAKINKESTIENLVRILTSSKKFKPYRGFAKMGGFTSSNFSLPDFSSIKKTNCTKEQFKKVSLVLSKKFSIEPHYKFIFKAINEAHLKDEYDMAILNLAIAFEVALSHYYFLLFLFYEQPNLKNNADAKKILKLLEKFADIPLRHRIEKFEKYKSIFEKASTNKMYSTLLDEDSYNKWHSIVWKKGIK